MFKKIQKNSFVTGFLCALLLVGTSSVFASDLVKDQIDVIYNNIKLVIDGGTVEFGEDSAGNTIQPFIYNGTTYLPVRTVAEALGKEVAWDGQTNTVVLGKANITDADMFLNNMTTFSSTSRYLWGSSPWKNYSKNSMSPIVGEVKDNTDRTFTNGLSVYMIGSGTGGTKGLTVNNEYLLNQEYTRFTGTYFLYQNYKSSIFANAKLVVYGDDQVIYESEPMQKGVLPMDFDIDVTNVIKLKVHVYNDSVANDMDYEDRLQFGIANPGLYK